MNSAPSATDEPTTHFSKPARFLLVAALLALIITVATRAIVKESDGGLANVLTLIMGFVTWLLAVLGLWLSPWPRSLAIGVAAAPLVLTGVLLSAYRFTRFDGELVPQFESRWTSKAKLPESSGPAASEASAAAPDSAERELVPAQARVVSATDFPQFLGKERSGVVEGVRLDPGWIARPPEVLWKQPIGAGWSGFAVQGDVAVTLEQRDNEQWVSAYDVLTGKLYWHTAFAGSHYNPMGGAGPRATPAIDQDQVFAQTATGQVACINLASGKIVWQADLLKLGEWTQSASEAAISWGRSGSPLIVNQLVVLPLGGPDGVKDRSLVALDRQTGEVRWRAGDDQIGYSSPTLTRLLDKEQIVIMNEGTVSGHEIDTGKLLWSVPWSGHSNSSANCSQTVTIGTNQMLISKGYAQGSKLVEFAVDAGGTWSHKVLWEDVNLLKTKFTSPVVLGDYAYGLSDGILECARIADGKRQWRGRGYKHGQLLLVGDTLLVMAEQGDLALVSTEPRQFKELARIPVLSGVTWNVPSLSGDRLLVRNSDEAACLKLPTK